MNQSTEFIAYSFVIGVGATAVIDLWALLLKQFLGIPSMNWAHVGRWFGHMPGGHFLHASIAKVTPVRGEKMLGWSAHYAIGVVFAGLLLLVWGIDWARQPTLLPALIVGIATIAAPFFLMQPGLGMGIAAARTPKPAMARLRSLVTHTIFGCGLYIAAALVAAIMHV